MPERKYEVKTVGVDYVCDACGDGVMELTGVMLPSDPPKWPHKCNRCGHTLNMTEKYPTVRFERAPEPSCCAGVSNTHNVGIEPRR